MSYPDCRISIPLPCQDNNYYGRYPGGTNPNLGAALKGAAVDPTAALAAIVARVKLIAAAAGINTASGTLSRSGAPALTIVGNQLVDQNGNPFLPIGVNVSGLENSAVQGSSNYWNDSGYSGVPPFAQWKSLWKINTFRLPINVSSLIGSAGPINNLCYNGDGSLSSNGGKPDPNNDYQTILLDALNIITALGLAIFIDFHWCAPAFTLGGTANRFLMPMGQSPMADAATCIPGMKILGNLIKSFPNVCVEGFNEPFLDQFGGPFTNASGGSITDWVALVQGGFGGSFTNRTGKGPFTITQSWQIAGHNQLIVALASTGAQNPYFASGLNYCGDLTGYCDGTTIFTAALPTDARGQLGFCAHVYPVTQFPGGTPTITNGGSGWTSGDVGKSISLATPVGCYYATILTITAVSGGAVTGAVYAPYAFGNAYEATNGLWLTNMHPSGAVAMASTTGGGGGVTITLGNWQNYSSQQNIPANWNVFTKLATVYPVCLTESGDHNLGGNLSSAPWTTPQQSWCVTENIGWLGWGGYLAGAPDFILVSNQALDPTGGYGVATKTFTTSL